MTQDIEADKLIYFITPLILDVNLNIFYIGGTTIKADNVDMNQSNLQLFRRYVCFNENNAYDLNILYRFWHYDCCYLQNFINAFSIPLFSLNFNYDESNYKKLCTSTGYVHKENDFIECSNCNEINEQIIFPDQNNYICKNCTKKQIKDGMSQRLTHFINENYTNLECNYKF